MRITRLELHGFKSFADRTVFAFGHGISCVVGPNGCGKSNVIDALRWCIGEQSARSLRGDDMQDVIFAGSSDRKPVGYAEVAITFTSEGGDPFPGDYARYTEVQIARRLYRSGASEYLINQTRVRRKDILDLIMDTGIGNDLYSFIEQGRIDKIVSASPEDRRALIDEAAGIVRYKKRREEARQKLEATSTQLDRAADVSDEMFRRLSTLEKQVIKAARFRQLRALVRQEEILLALAKQADLAEVREEVGGRLTELGTKVTTLDASVIAKTDDVILRQGEVDVATAAAEDARETLAEIDAQRREALATAQLQEQRANELGTQFDRAREDLEDDARRLAQAEESGRAAETELKDVDAALGGATSLAAGARVRLTETSSARDEARVESRSAEAAAGEAAAERAERTARVESLKARAIELPERIALVRGRLDASADERIILDKRIAVARSVLEDRSGKIAEIDARRAAAAEELESRVRRDLHARDSVRKAEADLDGAQKALAEAMAAAEATAGQADEEVAARVGRVAQQEENRVRDLERAAARALSETEDKERHEVARAEQAARAATEAARSGADSALGQWRTQTEASLARDEAAREQAIDQAVATATKELDAAEKEGMASVTAEIAAARERRDQAEARLTEARAALQDADARMAMAVKRRREVEGRIAAMEAEEAAAGSRDAGGRAVKDAVPDAPRLLDALKKAGVDPATVSTLVGDRLLLPALGDGVLGRAAAAARKAGRARVILAGRAASLDALMAGVAVVDTLEAALAHHVKTGGAAVVRESGERVDSDGVVHLGSAGEEAEAAVARQAALDQARADLDARSADVAVGEGEVTAGRARVEAGSIAARKAAEQVDASERLARERVATLIASVRAAGEARIRDLRQQRAEGRGAARAAFEAELATRVAGRDEQVVRARGEADAGLAKVRESLVARQAERRTVFEAEREARRVEVAAKLEAARLQAWEAVRATTADVAVRRERLREETDGLRVALEKSRRRADREAMDLMEGREAVAVCTRERAAEDLVVVRVQAERDGAEESKRALDERVIVLTSERETLERSLAEVSAALAEQIARLDAVLTRAADAEGALAATRARLLEREASADAARQTLTDADSALASLRERRAAAEATSAASVRERETTSVRIEGARQRLGEIEMLRAAALEALRDANERANQRADERQIAVVRLDAARERMTSVRVAYDTLVSTLREEEAALTQARADLLAAEQRHQAAVGELESLRARIEERYQLDLPAALEQLIARSGLVLEPPDDVREPVEVGERKVDAVGALIIRPEMLDDEVVIKDFVTRIEEHRRQLSSLGDVNLTALEEYTELAGRYKELDGQRADLDESVNSLKSAIAKMNKTCREQFRETFDRVNEAFKTAYPNLVGGGEARLQLTQEEDLLETGVEVVVRPPGKRLQTLSLLSGGEKAMTAIALLLALFSVKPSPFCVLDEVDAPLDEANGARFNDMLRQMCDKTQFLVVTHNRKTMECADTLYGVTMPTPGVSTLVSVRVD